jgi:hypothetical protein
VTSETLDAELVTGVTGIASGRGLSAAVNTRIQPRFKKFRFDEARLNLHRHRDDDAKRLIVFVPPPVALFTQVFHVDLANIARIKEVSIQASRPDTG